MSPPTVLPVTQNQPPPTRVPGGVDVIADLAARVAVSGTRALDGRTAALVDLLLSRCAPADLPPRARHAWLCSELAERRRLGVARYGTPLQAGNGRDAEADLRQELLDACAYSWQVALEAEARIASPRPGAECAPDLLAGPDDGARSGGLSEPECPHCGRTVEGVPLGQGFDGAMD